MSLRGVSGHLVSFDYVEHRLEHAHAGELGEAGRSRAHAAMARWWASGGVRLGPASSLRAIFDIGLVPVLEILGFTARDPRPARQAGMLLASADAGGQTIPAVVTPWGATMDHAWGELARESGLVAADWAIVFNGRALRLCDARRPHARAFIEFDLEQLPDVPAAHALCWALLRADALHALTGAVAAESARHGIAVAALLREGVHDALALLLQGLADSRRRRSRAQPGPARLEAALDEALTVVYRVLFLLFAESRALVPLWHPVYRRSYTIEALRVIAERPGRPKGLWESLQALSRLAHAGCHAGSLTVTPFNGRLFAPSRTPIAESCRLDDGLVARALMSLTTHGAGGRRDRICFRDLGVEQLGAIYESVLDYEPVADPAQGTQQRSRDEPHAPVRLASTGTARKSSGTFYTPEAITAHLVRHTLEPLVADAGPEAILRLRVLDPAMGSGAFLVAACRYLASAYEGALVRDLGLFPSAITEADRAGYRRLVAQRCLYGVDVNPMAVQVARLSLWLTTLAEHRPLSFLDHHLAAGNSLVGASLDDLARQPPGSGASGRPHSVLPLFDDEDGAGQALRAALPIRAQLAELPDDSAAIVHDKERLLSSLDRERSGMATLKRMADLWCACWFWSAADPARPGPAEFGELLSAIRTGRSSLPAHLIGPRLIEARRLARAHRFFHWTLEFPEVFFDGNASPQPHGGFDAILGNPPWEMLRGDTGPAHARAERRNDIRHFTRFARESGVFSAGVGGHLNQYQLFLERSISLLKSGGRLGLVLPWGLASDHGSAGLRRLLLDRCDVGDIVGFDNADAIFPIHRGVRFLLLSAARGGPTGRTRCRLGVRDPHALEPPAEADEPQPGGDRRDVVFTPALLRRLAGPGLALPWVRNAAELRLIERIAASVPPLGDQAGWGARFGRELNATDDRARFVTEPGALTVVEGKHLDPFRVRVDEAGLWIRSPAVLPSADLARAVSRQRLAYRDVAASTNRTTLIAALVPPGVVTVHTLFCLRTQVAIEDQWLLCGLLNSLAANFLVRPWVTTHLGTTTVERLPVPRPAPGEADGVRVVELARRLSAEPDCEDFRAELDARVFRLYGMNSDEIGVVLETFPLIESRLKTAIADRFGLLAFRRGRV